MGRPTNQVRAFKIALESPLKILAEVEKYSEVLVENEPNHCRGHVLSVGGQVGIIVSLNYEPMPNQIFSLTRVYTHKDVIAWLK